MMLYPPIPVILFVSEMFTYILCVDLCKGCGIHFILYCLSSGGRQQKWYQQFPKPCIHICKDDKRSELPRNAATTLCSSQTGKFVLNVMRVSHSYIDSRK